MTATDELRDGLTKRGIEWRWKDEHDNISPALDALVHARFWILD